MVRKIVDTALDNLKNITAIGGIYRENYLQNADGAVELIINNNRILIPIEVKKELRKHQINQLLALKQRLGTETILVIANTIYPNAKEELRHLNIAYLEVNGNVYLNIDNNIIWIEAQKPVRPEKETNRAFTPTGLKVVFDIILEPDIINLTQREIANITKVGLGQINNVFRGLKEDRFLIPKSKNEFILNRKEDLFQKWLNAFEERLKPKIQIGNFRFVKHEEFFKWNELILNKNLTFWGGEPAGNLLTNYLEPATLILYTEENKQDLIKHLKLLPDIEGNVNVYQKFWHTEWVNTQIVPPELAYADLIFANNHRCRETAEKIYNEYIKNRFN